jgi:MFS family permease
MIKNRFKKYFSAENNPPESENGKTIPAENRTKFSIKNTFAALKHPNYRLWFFGQIVSLLGSWMQMTAQGFFIYELTHSPAFLGYVGFANGIPTWLFMVYAGVYADRFPRRTIILIAQTVMMILAFILAFLTFSGVVQPWHILVLTFLLGIANAFEAPARQAFVNELVDKEDLVNAIALNSTMFHSGAAIGPAVAGITYAIFGPAWCFTINGISFLPVIYNLVKMKLKPIPKITSESSALRNVIDGIKYLKTQKLIMMIMVITACSSTFGLSMVTLFPAWAVNILHGDAATNGLLQTARGIGAVLCSLIIASASKHMERGKVLSIGMISLPILMLLFSFNRTFLISSTILVFIGAAFIAINNLANAIVQTNVVEEFRGRVMGIYSFSFFALMPVGSLIIGIIAEHLGTPSAILVNALIMLSIYGWLNFRFPKLKEAR